MFDRSSLRRIVIVSTPHKPVGQQTGAALGHWIRQHGIEVIEDLDSDKNLCELEADLAISVGGDGTVLTTARRMHDRPIPTLGVNVGKLGFLAEFAVQDIRHWISGQRPLPMTIKPRMYICAHVQTGSERVTCHALNDVSFQQGLMTKLLRIDMWVDNSHAIEYRADGLIVATPVGSTAYSLSVGGPIVTPDLKAFIISPIAPHTLTNRPVVIGANQNLKFSFRRGAQSMALVVDGHEQVPLQERSTVEIEASPNEFPLISHGRRNFYYLLRQKLAWGEQPSGNQRR